MLSLTPLWESFRVAVLSLRTNKLRTGLTLVGIVVGVSAVIGTDLVENLFGGAPLEQVVGQEIRIEGRPFEIIGVVEPVGKIFGVSRDNVAYIPFPTYQKMYS